MPPYSVRAGYSKPTFYWRVGLPSISRSRGKTCRGHMRGCHRTYRGRRVSLILSAQHGATG